MTSFLKNTDHEIADQLENWSIKLPKYKTDFSLTVAEVNAALADARYFRYVLTLNRLHDAYQYELSLYLERLKNNPNNIALGGFPTLPVMPTAPAEVDGGILDRFIALAERIKQNTLFNNEIGQDLGIISIPYNSDLTTVKAVATIITRAGQPAVKWMQHGLDGIEIWKDLGEGSFALVGFEKN